MTEFKSHLAAHQNSPFQANLGMMLLSLVLLMSIPLLMAVICTLSLLLLLWTTLKKLLELLKHIVRETSSVQYILCRLVDVRKSITSMLKKSPKHVWSEVGASHQDSTSAYSEMRGGLENAFDAEDFIADEQKKSKNRSKTLEDRVREAGI